VQRIIFDEELNLEKIYFFAEFEMDKKCQLSKA